MKNLDEKYIPFEEILTKILFMSRMSFPLLSLETDSLVYKANEGNFAVFAIQLV